MTKEQQKEAAKRIMEKMGPMSAEEQETYNRLVKSPGEYTPPSGDRRTCGICGATFRDQVDAKGNVGTPSLEKFVDHQVSHNPTTDRWSEAYRKVQAGKEAAKEST